MVNIKIKPAEYYQSAFKNNLSLCGVEDGEPQFIGSNEGFINFYEETKNLC